MAKKKLKMIGELMKKVQQHIQAEEKMVLKRIEMGLLARIKSFRRMLR